MTHTHAALNSKGGVGKTTFLANLGGVLAAIGARTLLVDDDPQPSLTRYFRLTCEASHGLVEEVTQGATPRLAISRASIADLHIVRSNDGECRNRQYRQLTVFKWLRSFDQIAPEARSANTFSSPEASPPTSETVASSGPLALAEC
jgi:cellulose biosynthesis protein BcsQ